MIPVMPVEFEYANLERLGDDLHSFAAELYPICRSITGNGIRQTLEKIGERIRLDVSEVPSGTAVFDWTVPKEWNIRDAWIKDAQGRRIVDFHEHNLHVVNYSVPVLRRLSLGELRPHLHTLPDRPNWIPYRTSYYKEDWGFCLTHNQLAALEESEYEVCIDASLEDGSLSYGECFLPGKSTEEVLISVHACHPSLANDNLSGVTIATALAQMLGHRDHHYSYRFLFIPGTIGAITWLSRNQEAAAQVRHGLVLTCIGDAGGFHYKKSRRGDAEIDRAMAHVLRHSGETFEVLEFSPYGYDERQYCSPGFNLPVGCLMRSVWGSFPEYHTSADNLDFIQPKQLARSYALCASAIDALENNRTYLNQNPFCEPQLGRRGLYRSTGGESIDQQIHARLWVLNLSDGEHSLLDIAERAGLPFAAIQNAAEILRENGLLAEQGAAAKNSD
jgi:aminopeptidase-like protein